MSTSTRGAARAPLPRSFPERLIRVTTRKSRSIYPAVWRRMQHGWVCIRAAPALRWMRGRDARFVGERLSQLGLEWGWA